ncbi:hypothetical protein HDU93_006865, partial [Gonapodya sp. JEL0774]
KLFKGDEWVHKHLRLKHPAVVEDTLKAVEYFNCYAVDPAKLTTDKVAGTDERNQGGRGGGAGSGGGNPAGGGMGMGGYGYGAMQAQQAMYWTSAFDMFGMANAWNGGGGWGMGGGGGGRMGGGGGGYRGGRGSGGGGRGGDRPPRGGGRGRGPPPGREILSYNDLDSIAAGDADEAPKISYD